MSDVEIDFHKTWLGFVQPVEGLVFSIPVLVDAGCMERKPVALQQRLRELAQPTSPDPGAARQFRDLDQLLADILGLTPDLFDRGESLPADLSLYVPEGRQEIRPTLALRKQSTDEKSPRPGDSRGEGQGEGDLLPDASTPQSRAGAAYEMLVWSLPPGLDLDKPETQTGPWEYTPAAKFDRLLRACRVPIGLLTNHQVIRLIYAPHGEATGSITFSLATMADAGGRPVLDAFATLLSASRFFAVSPERQLPQILRDSRRRQANVTNQLADQVRDALEILLRGFEAAASRDKTATLNDALARADDHVYGGLLTVLLRLVFLLYAEDRELLPIGDGRYFRHYSVLGLFEQLQDDNANFPDTMVRRFGAWPRLVALFRIVFEGAQHGSVVLPARRGDLFDPERYPFLEGWPAAGGAPVDAAARAGVQVPSVDDESIYRVLEKLLYLDHQRLSYRALDVEQIGSVYEALMGFHVVPMPSRAVCVRGPRVWVAVSDLLEAPLDRRAAWLEDEAGVDKSAVKKAGAEIKAAKTEDEMLAALQAIQARDTEVARPLQLVLQPGAERRRTSSHYTPRSLSEPIVRRTLEPLIGAMTQVDGAPPSNRLLDLKICDPAMGSGAFLVAACRFLADQVVAAWTREGRLPALASATEDVVTQARRLVAQRCLYGVDKNPFAVSLAKLSLWLVTLAKEEPFTFVDHALRHGDSLVGLSLDQIRAFHWKPESQLELVGKEIETAVDEALALRLRILELAREHGSAVTKEKERLLWDAEDALDRVRVIADLIVGAFFAADSDKARLAERNRRLDLVSTWLRDGGPVPAELRDLCDELRRDGEGRKGIPPFHWMTEFPEVFYGERRDPLDKDRVNRAAWMDAFVGNPPFLGGRNVSSSLGEVYSEWLQTLHPGSHGSADLCVHFFRRADFLLGQHGTIGLIATNTIAQGDTRNSGLQYIVKGGTLIFEGVRTMPWPGEANVAVSIVHLAKGHAGSVSGLKRRLDGAEVGAINSRLRPKPERPDPQSLTANAQLAFQGVILRGDFTITREQHAAFMSARPNNAECLFPYLGGEEVNGSPRPDRAFERYVIGFGDRALEACRPWADLLKVVKDQVKPDRDRAKIGPQDAQWWQWWRPRAELSSALHGKTRCLVTSIHSKHLLFSFCPAHWVFSHALLVFAFEEHARFAVLQSRIHEQWARLLSSSMRNDLRYSASDCLDTFAFPAAETLAPTGDLEAIGARLYETRARLMVERNQGLTTTYNQLKDPACDDPEILALRRLHEDLDRAVLAAYAWPDIPVPAYETPTTPATRAAQESFEDEIIDRLFALNATRAEQEKLQGAAKAAASPTKKAARKKPAAADKQLDLADQPTRKRPKS
jgi:hypothetical protein